LGCFGFFGDFKGVLLAPDPIFVLKLIYIVKEEINKN